jgi:hypothetical protein
LKLWIDVWSNSLHYCVDVKNDLILLWITDAFNISLIQDCLSVSSAKRPKINEILKASVIQSRIKSFLTSTQ